MLSPEEEGKLVKIAMEHPLKAGEIWCVVSRTWFERWCAYTGSEYTKDGQKVTPTTGPLPGPIDNSSLVVPSLDWAELKQGIQEHVDYELIPEATWEQLVAWHKGGPAIPRRVISVGNPKPELRIEMYPLHLIFFEAEPKTGEPGKQRIIKSFDGTQTFIDVLSSVKKTDREARIWFKPAPTTPTPTAAAEVKEEKKGGPSAASSSTAWSLVTSLEINVPFNTITDKVSSGSMILADYRKLGAHNPWSRYGAAGKPSWREFAVNDDLDAKDKDGKWYESTIREVRGDKVLIHFKGWPNNWDERIDMSGDRLAPKSMYSTGPYVSNEQALDARLFRQHSAGVPIARGAVGLKNLGNSCFMNSTLQCLANAPGLTEFFLENRYLQEINRSNPLGWNGKIAEEYGRLIQDVWCGQFRTVAPRQLKQAIGEFQPRFSGYQQQDSSELLSFLLDGLHEDLNRVKSKPATEAVESKGRPDPIVAEEAWRRHLMRNQSIIVDLFQGQHKSRVVCPECHQDSITFDPFMFLSVPLPQEERVLEVIAVPSPVPVAGASPQSQPVRLSVRLPKTQATPHALKELLANEWFHAPPHAIQLWEVANGKLANRVERALPKPGPTPLIAYHIPMWSDSKPPAANKMAVQVVHGHFEQRGTERTFRFSSTSTPTVMLVPHEKYHEMEATELRALVRQSVAHMIKGGLTDEDTAEKMFDLLLCNADVNRPMAEITGTEGKINLSSEPLDKGWSIAVGWKEEYRVRLLIDFVRAPAGSPFAYTPSSRGVQLADCLNAFSREEILSPSDAWYCPNCKKHQCASKKMDLWRLPDNLIIHLKRFNYDRSYRDKLETLVDFPTDGLDMSRWLVPGAEEKSGTVYDLYATSNHYGGLGGGHYTAYAKNLFDGRWYTLDDSTVTPLSSPEETITKAAYVLFYRRRQQGTPMPGASAVASVTDAVGSRSAAVAPMQDA